MEDFDVQPAVPRLYIGIEGYEELITHKGLESDGWAPENADTPQGVTLVPVNTNFDQTSF